MNTVRFKKKRTWIPEEQMESTMGLLLSPLDDDFELGIRSLDSLGIKITPGRVHLLNTKSEDFYYFKSGGKLIRYKYVNKSYDFTPNYTTYPIVPISSPTTTTGYVHSKTEN